MNNTGIYYLLNEIVKDHTTYSFPISSVNRDLNQLFFNQKSFDNLCASIFLKLKRKHGKMVAHIFYLSLDRVFPKQLMEIDSIPPSKYCDKIEELILLLHNIRITRIPKDSPDGIMMQEMP